MEAGKRGEEEEEEDEEGFQTADEEHEKDTETGSLLKSLLS